MVTNVPCHVFGRGNARHDDGGCDREQERGDLCNKTVADRQEDVDLCSVRNRQVVLERANNQATNHVDNKDQNAGDCVALDELRGPVHRSIEFGLFANLFAPGGRFFGCQDSGVQVGINRHLLAGHCIEREARRHFGHTS